MMLCFEKEMYRAWISGDAIGQVSWMLSLADRIFTQMAYRELTGLVPRLLEEGGSHCCTL